VGRLIYLLDTNVLSEPLAARPDTEVLHRIAKFSANIATSVVTWQEMLFGMYRLPPSKRRMQVDHYLGQRVNGVIPILPFDEDAAEWQAKERARLTQIGRPPSYVDSQIAAIAATHDLTLVTRNIQDFSEFNDLQVENWFG
jgi:tRNA(fMet)-specific endonuclease VapC